MLTCPQVECRLHTELHAAVLLLYVITALKASWRGQQAKGIYLQVAQRAAGAGNTSAQQGTGSGNGSSSMLYLVDKNGRVRNQVCSGELGYKPLSWSCCLFMSANHIVRAAFDIAHHDA